LGKDVLKKLNSNFSYKHKIRFSQIKDSLINGDINAAEWIGPYDEITILELNKAKTKEGKPLFYHYLGW
jgi:TRAP-type mannitol/chloroaromatic compound transport system substrate-binding protein